MNVYVKRQNYLWQKIAASAVILIALVILLNIFQSPVRNSFHTISSPFSNILLQAGGSSAGLLNSFAGVSGLTQENANLKQENQDLLFRITTLQETMRQNQELQTARSSTEGSQFNVTQAKIIALDTAQDLLTLNKGSADGITENMPVISSQKVVFGKVLKVYKNFSVITLITSVNSVVDVKIQNSDPAVSAVNGAVKGTGGAAYLDLVASDADISSGQTLVTSGLEGIYPPDLLIGIVTQVQKNDAKAFQTASLTPFLNIKNTDSVFIINDYLKP